MQVRERERAEEEREGGEREGGEREGGLEGCFSVYAQFCTERHQNISYMFHAHAHVYSSFPECQYCLCDTTLYIDIRVMSSMRSVKRNISSREKISGELT